VEDRFPPARIGTSDPFFYVLVEVRLGRLDSAARDAPVTLACEFAAPCQADTHGPARCVLMCSYWRSRLLLHDSCGMIRLLSMRQAPASDLNNMPASASMLLRDSLGCPGLVVGSSDSIPVRCNQSKDAVQGHDRRP